LDPNISVEEELVNKILSNLGEKLDEEASCKELVDPICTNTVLTKLDSHMEREKIRKEIVEAFIISSWTQRIYFDVRSIIMTIFGAILTAVVFWRVGTVNITGDFLLGFSTYFIALILSRLFDSKIVDMSRSFLRYIEGHNKLRDFIVKTF
jgi:hypothetical protein